jgi:hypothetical protein
MAWDDFAGDPTGAESNWGRSAVMNAFPGTDSVIAVDVRPGDRTFEPSFIPRSVNWTLQYYQVDQGSKRLVTSWVSFGNYCTVTTAPDLQLQYEAAGVPACKKGDNFVSSPVTENYQYTLTFKLEAAGKSKATSHSATLVRPETESEFYEMIHLFVMVVISLGLSSAIIVMKFPARSPV